MPGMAHTEEGEADILPYPSRRNCDCGFGAAAKQGTEHTCTIYFRVTLSTVIHGLSYLSVHEPPTSPQRSTLLLASSLGVLTIQCCVECNTARLGE